MAIEWYRIDAGLKNHPKRIRVQKITGCSKLEAIAYITLLFTFTATYAEDGGIQGFSPSEIEDACEWAGQEGLLYRAFVEARLIDESPEGRIVHNWYEKNWKHVEDKRRRNHAYRESKKAEKHPEDDSGSTHSHQEERNERTNERTDEPFSYSSPGERLRWAKQRFLLMRAGHPAYKGKGGYTWSERDRKAINRALYPDADNGGYYPNQEELERGLANFFASDAKWSADHSAFYLFERFNQFVIKAAVDHTGTTVGRGDVKGGRKPAGSGFSTGQAIEGKGKRVSKINWNDHPRDDGKTETGQVAATTSRGNDEKV